MDETNILTWQGLIVPVSIYIFVLCVITFSNGIPTKLNVTITNNIISLQFVTDLKFSWVIEIINISV